MHRLLNTHFLKHSIKCVTRTDVYAIIVEHQNAICIHVLNHTSIISYDYISISVRSESYIYLCVLFKFSIATHIISQSIAVLHWVRIEFDYGSWPEQFVEVL